MRTSHHLLAFHECSQNAARTFVRLTFLLEFPLMSFPIKLTTEHANKIYLNSFKLILFDTHLKDYFYY